MESQIKNLFKDTTSKHYPKGQILIYEGDPTDYIYYINSGYVKVYNILPSGAERIFFIYFPGDFFPLTSYLSQAGAVHYFYESMTDVDLYVLRSELIEEKVKNNFSLGEALIAYTNGVNQQFFTRIEALSVKSARQKVISLLMFLAEKCGKASGQVELDMPLTSQDIADLCGLTRETASAQLVRLKKEGVIGGRRHLTIDVSKLERLKTQLHIPDLPAIAPTT
jgi:CRP-like cAMP-binding protein